MRIFPRRWLYIASTLAHWSGFLGGALPQALPRSACLHDTLSLHGPMYTWPTFLHIPYLDPWHNPSQASVSDLPSCPAALPELRAAPPSPCPASSLEHHPALFLWVLSRGEDLVPLPVNWGTASPCLEYLHQEDTAQRCTWCAPAVGMLFSH